MNACPKCNDVMAEFDSNIIVNADKPWKKAIAKICNGCSFVEIYHK
jgi:hypothetical protein